MASNYKQAGDVLTLTAPSGGVVAGSGYVIGGLFVVALNTAEQGVEFEGMRRGVFEMPKATGAGKGFDAGEGVFWDNTQKRWDKTGAGSFPAGIAARAAGTADATVEVLVGVSPVAAVGG